MLPISKVGPGGASFIDALFTATSAVCVTGLTVVDTPTYWTGVRSGRHPAAHPARRARDHDLRVADRTCARAQAVRALPAQRRGRGQGGRDATTSGAGPRHRPDLARRSRPPSFADALASDSSSATGTAFGEAAWHGRLPCGLVVQQRRLRAVQRQPDRLRRRPVHLPARSAPRSSSAGSASR